MKEKKYCILRTGIFLILCIVLSGILNWITMPPNVIWMNLHQLKSEGPYDYLFIGTSHGQYGISPEVIERVTGKKSFNLCMADEYPVDTYYLMKEAYKEQKPKKIIYELDPSYWMMDQRLGATAILFYKELPWSKNKAEYFLDKIMKLDYRESIFPWSYYRNNLLQAPQIIKKKMSREYREYAPAILDVPGGHYGGRGFLYQDAVEGADKGTYNNVPWDEGQVRSDAIRYFEKMVSYCRKEGIELEAITLPVPTDTVANMPESYERSDQYFEELMERYQVPYHNFNMDSELDFDRSMDSYWDYDGHMYGPAGEKFSEELGEYLKKNNKENVN